MVPVYHNGGQENKLQRPLSFDREHVQSNRQSEAAPSGP